MSILLYRVPLGTLLISLFRTRTDLLYDRSSNDNLTGVNQSFRFDEDDLASALEHARFCCEVYELCNVDISFKCVSFLDRLRKCLWLSRVVTPLR